MYYYVGPWRYGKFGWEAPEGTVGLVDLRSIPAVRREVEGLGFFASHSRLTSEFELFGDQPGRNAGRRQAQPLAVDAGYHRFDPVARLLDVLWDTLTFMRSQRRRPRQAALAVR